MGSKRLKIQRSGLTLIEVVAGLAILSSLLTTILVAHQRQVSQIQSSNQVHTAIELSNPLLQSWLDRPDDIPPSPSGFLGDSKEFQWELQPISFENEFGLKTLKYTVTRAEDTNATPLLTVDLVFPMPRIAPIKQ